MLQFGPQMPTLLIAPRRMQPVVIHYFNLCGITNPWGLTY